MMKSLLAFMIVAFAVTFGPIQASLHAQLDDPPIPPKYPINRIAAWTGSIDGVPGTSPITPNCVMESSGQWKITNNSESTKIFVIDAELRGNDTNTVYDTDTKSKTIGGSPAEGVPGGFFVFDPVSVKATHNPANGDSTYTASVTISVFALPPAGSPPGTQPFLIKTIHFATHTYFPLAGGGGLG